jgi:hypothetical protein
MVENAVRPTAVGEIDLRKGPVFRDGRFLHAGEKLAPPRASRQEWSFYRCTLARQRRILERSCMFNEWNQAL